MRRSKLLKLRRIIELAVGFLEDREALEAVELYPHWDGSGVYEKDQRVRYGGKLYRCIQSHSAQAGWNPELAASLWARVLVEQPADVSQWVQPDSTNPYQKGDRVEHQGRIWVSLYDHNTWEPGVFGWEEAK